MGRSYSPGRPGTPSLGRLRGESDTLGNPRSGPDGHGGPGVKKGPTVHSQLGSDADPPKSHSGRPGPDQSRFETEGTPSQLPDLAGGTRPVPVSTPPFTRPRTTLPTRLSPPGLSGPGWALSPSSVSDHLQYRTDTTSGGRSPSKDKTLEQLKSEVFVVFSFGSTGTHPHSPVTTGVGTWNRGCGPPRTHLSRRRTHKEPVTGRDPSLRDTPRPEALPFDSGSSHLSYTHLTKDTTPDLGACGR